MTAPQRTLVLSREYPPFTVGGTSTVARSVAVGMTRLGHEVQVVTTNPHAAEDICDDVDGVLVHRTGTRLIYNAATELTGSVLATHRSLLRAADGILSAESAFDTIVIPDLFCFPEARLLAKRHGLPLVNILLQDFAAMLPFNVGSHHHVTDGVSADPAQLLSLEQRALNDSDHTIFISHALRSAIVTRYPFAAATSSTVHLGVDGAEIDDILADPRLPQIRAEVLPDPDTTLAVACGRMVPVKGFDALLSALPLLARPVHLVLIGIGPELPALREQAERLGVADRVTFLGDPPRRRALSLFAVADVNVVPSLWESFCYVCAEMMVLGRPVVATTVDSLNELMPDSSVGYRVAVHHEPDGRRSVEPAALASAIDAVSADPEEAGRRAARAARHIRKEFSNDRFAAGVAQVSSRHSGAGNRRAG